MCGFSMFACMLVRRTVAAQGYATLLASAQMHPACVDLDAFFANSVFGLFDVSDRIDMSA